MYNLVDNSQYSISSWQNTLTSLDLGGQVNGAGVLNAANRLTIASSGNALLMITSLFPNIDITSKQITFSIAIGNVTSLDNLVLRIGDVDGSNSFAVETLSGMSDVWSRHNIVTIPTSTVNGFSISIDPPTLDDSVTRRMDFADVYVLVDGVNYIGFEPEYPYTEGHRKVENTHRVRSGASYVYKWGEYKEIKTKLSFVSSEQKSIINSYWNSNAEILLTNSDNIEVSSVRIMNRKLPVGGLIKPYNDLFLGTLELGSY